MTRWRFFLLIFPLVAGAETEVLKINLTSEDSLALKKLAKKSPQLHLVSPDGSLELRCGFQSDPHCTLEKWPVKNPSLAKRLDGFGGTTVVFYERASDCAKLKKSVGNFESQEKIALTSSNEKFFRVPRLRIRVTQKECEWQANFNPPTGKVERER